MFISGNPKTEAQLEKAVTKALKDNDVLGYKFSSPNKRGVPDRIYISPTGRVIFCEFKSPTGNGVLSELQKEQIKRLRNNNANVHVVGTGLEAERFINYVISLGVVHA